MRYLVGLTVTLIIHGFSAKAIHSPDTLHNNVAIANKLIAGNKVHEAAYDTSGSTIRFQINVLAVKNTPDGIQLNWLVEETANLQYFLIEHSTDGQSFLPLYEVPALLQQQTYSFVDVRSKARDKQSYYRVKAIYPTAVIASPIQKL